MDKTGKEWIYKKTLKDIGVDVYDFRQETEQIECYKKWDAIQRRWVKQDE